MNLEYRKYFYIVSLCCSHAVFCCSRGLDVTPITLALSGAAAYPRACQALSSMLSRKALNPADMTQVSDLFPFVHVCGSDE